MCYITEAFYFWLEIQNMDIFNITEIHVRQLTELTEECNQPSSQAVDPGTVK